VVTATPADTVDHAMRLMTDRRIRHLPVLQGEKVVGVVSIGDLVRSIIDAQRSTIEALQSYIQG
jgi:CBS domain-containing protein